MEQTVYRPNKISHYQRVFQSAKPGTPVFLRGKSDRFIFRSAMFVSVLGIGVTMYGIYLMATGKMPKKER